MSFFDKLFGRKAAPEAEAGGVRPAAMPFVEIPSGQTPITLASVEIRAVVSGLYAETTATLRFYNPNARVLEGSLVFPLPDGAVVCGYALDVAGRMVDGVVVPKKEARRILEAEVRKGVDPGLVEQVQGNVYRTRLYPLPVHGTRTVRLTWVSELTVIGQDAAYHLPLSWAGEVERVHVRIDVIQAPVEPVLGGLGLSLGRQEERWVAEATLPKGTATADLHIGLPGLPERFVAVERDAQGATFCASALLPDALGRAATWHPTRIGLVWDASGSRADTSRELALLETLLTRWEAVTVDLVVVRDVVEPAESHVVGPESCAAFVERLRAIPTDGGTDLTKLDLATSPHADTEAWLLFTDGMGTVGRGLPTLGGLPVFAISSAAESDSAWLDHVARQTGGARLNLLRVPTEAAVTTILRHQAALRVVRTPGCADVHSHVAQGRLTVLGRMLEPQGRIDLQTAQGETFSLEVRAIDGPPGYGLLARAWAGREVSRLALCGEEGEERILELGRRHGLVTPGSSLLVLETLEQYLEYDIEPAATWPELREAWLAQRSEARGQVRQRERDHVEHVLRMWEQRIAWWETDFRPRWEPEPPAEKRKMDEGPGAGAGPELARDAMPAEAPRMRSMAAPPAPAAPAPRVDLMMEEEPAMAPVYDAMEAEAALDDELMPEFERASQEERRSSSVASADARPAAEGARPEPEPTVATATMRIQRWSPDTPYLTTMKEAADPYAAYLGARATWGRSPAFYLDCADWLIESGRRAEGLRVLFNILEVGLDDPALLRMVAWRLGQSGELDRAVELLERVLSERDEEPQSHRDLALMLGERWERDRRAGDAERAMELLCDVILKEWDRFPEIELIALMELNRLVHLARPHGIEPPERLDRRLVRLLDLDARISMSWDADMTDVDIHVFEPTGEHAYYGNRNTRIGGLVSRDFTRGYGPEEYVLRDAYPGTYTIKAHYYGSSQQDITGACTVIVTVYTHYGRPQEHKQVLTLRLDRPSHQVLVGEITIARDPNEVYIPAWRRRFEGLRVGMTLDEVTALVGQPSSISGGAPLVLKWQPSAGVTVIATASPALSRVVATVGGEEVVLVG